LYKDAGGKFPDNKEISVKIRAAGGSLEKNVAKVMPLVTQLKEQLSSEGVDEAFSLGLSFDEKTIFDEILPFIRASLGVQNITVHYTTDAGIPETAQQLQPAQPGKPLVFFSAQ